jgi:hypothetical protein
MFMLHPLSLDLPPTDPDYRTNWMSDSPYIFGGNDSILLPGLFQLGTSNVYSIKSASGEWVFTNHYYYNLSFTSIAPNLGYGGLDCQPIVGDFDGDGKDDRTVMCPDDWRIAYSGDEFASQKDQEGFRRVPTGYGYGNQALPGKAYVGGYSYAKTKSIIQLSKSIHPDLPPPIIVDMPAVTAQ